MYWDDAVSTVDNIILELFSNVSSNLPDKYYLVHSDAEERIFKLNNWKVIFGAFTHVLVCSFGQNLNIYRKLLATFFSAETWSFSVRVSWITIKVIFQHVKDQIGPPFGSIMTHSLNSISHDERSQNILNIFFNSNLFDWGFDSAQRSIYRTEHTNGLLHENW
jgi:hypothetical protein